MFLLDDKDLKIECFRDGELQYATDVSGGQVHAGTITGTVAGGLLFGPLGALAGAVAPHSSGIKTKEIKHDNRTIVLRIIHPSGIIGAVEALADKNGNEIKDYRLQIPGFYNKLLQAVELYKKNKDAIDRKYSAVMNLKQKCQDIQDGYADEAKTAPAATETKEQPTPHEASLCLEQQIELQKLKIKKTRDFYNGKLEALRTRG